MRYDVSVEDDHIVVASRDPLGPGVRIPTGADYLAIEEVQQSMRGWPEAFDAWTLALDALEPGFLGPYKGGSYFTDPLPWQDVRPLCGVPDCLAETLAGKGQCQDHVGKWLG